MPAISEGYSGRAQEKKEILLYNYSSTTGLQDCGSGTRFTNSDLSIQHSLAIAKPREQYISAVQNWPGILQTNLSFIFSLEGGVLWSQKAFKQ